MHLISSRRQSVELAGERIDFAEGESIHTECSYKFTVAGLRALAARAALKARQVWTDSRGWFSVHYLTAV
jgi:uncharacterized SAM-dependent methyltransferase